MLELPRRKFLIGLTAFLAAPAIIRVADMMQVRSFSDELTVAQIMQIRAQLTMESARAYAGRGYVQILHPKTYAAIQRAWNHDARKLYGDAIARTL